MSALISPNLISLITFILYQASPSFDYGKWGIILAGCAILITIVIFLFNRSIKVNTTITRVETKVDNINSNVGGLSLNLESFKLVVFDKLLSIKSPINLTELGLKIAKESGVIKLVEDYYDEILKKVREIKLDNAYRAQQKILEIVRDLQYDEKCKNIVETGAFRTGRSINEILMLGGYFIRDRIFKDIGFAVDDIIEPGISDKKK